MNTIVEMCGFVDAVVREIERVYSYTSPLLELNVRPPRARDPFLKSQCPRRDSEAARFIRTLPGLILEDNCGAIARRAQSIIPPRVGRA
jgi:hypothetical protein